MLPSELVDKCEHKSVMPKFDEEQALHMSPLTVRKVFPRFEGKCPDCGKELTLYASEKHYVYGDF